MSENRLNGLHISGRFGFLKTESEPIFGFPHNPIVMFTDVVISETRVSDLLTMLIRQLLGGFHSFRKKNRQQLQLHFDKL